MLPLRIPSTTLLPRFSRERETSLLLACSLSREKPLLTCSLSREKTLCVRALARLPAPPNCLIACLLFQWRGKDETTCLVNLFLREAKHPSSECAERFAMLTELIHKEMGPVVIEAFCTNPLHEQEMATADVREHLVTSSRCTCRSLDTRPVPRLAMFAAQTPKVHDMKNRDSKKPLFTREGP
jgi:hypothetical protein